MECVGLQVNALTTRPALKERSVVPYVALITVHASVEAELAKEGNSFEDLVRRIWEQYSQNWGRRTFVSGSLTASGACGSSGMFEKSKTCIETVARPWGSRVIQSKKYKSGNVWWTSCTIDKQLTEGELMGVFRCREGGETSYHRCIQYTEMSTRENWSSAEPQHLSSKRILKCINRPTHRESLILISLSHSTILEVCKEDWANWKMPWRSTNGAWKCIKDSTDTTSCILTLQDYSPIPQICVTVKEI